MSGIIPEIFGKPVVKDGVVMDTQVSLIPEIFGEPIVENGVVADVLLSESETEKYERQGQLFKESDVKRDEGGRFSTQAASGADEDEGEVIETSGAALRKNVEAGITAGEIDPSALLGDETLGIPRHDMPQIIDDNTTQFIKELKDMGRTVKDVDIPVGQLRGTQGELNMDKVNFLLDKMKAGKWNWDFQEEKVLASSDGHILDGHHRWAAQRLFDPNSSMPIIQVDLNIRDLLDEAHAFDGVGYTGLEGSGVVESPDIQPSKAKVWVARSSDTSSDSDHNRDEDNETRAKKIVKTMFGDDAELQDLANLIGAPDSERVIVGVGGRDDQIDVAIHGDTINARRSFVRRKNGEVVCANEEMSIEHGSRGAGIGTRMLSKQVHFCRQMGVNRIDTFGERYGELDDDAGEYANGYSVWPRLGYDFLSRSSPSPPSVVRSGRLLTQSEIHSMPDSLWQRLNIEQDESTGHAKDFVSIHDILKSAEGRRWWDDKGDGVALTFDTREGSKSSKILDKYLRKRRAADRIPAKYAKQDDEPGTSGEGEEPDLSPEELEILEEVWEELEQEMEDGGYTLEDSKDS